MGEPITVWRFQDAPQELQDLSDNGGDEDWLALIPAAMADEWLPWLAQGWRAGFGVCCVNEYRLPDGRLVRIGCHS